MQDELAMLWHGNVKRGDLISLPGETGVWKVIKAAKIEKDETCGFQAILVRRQR